MSLPSPRSQGTCPLIAYIVLSYAIAWAWWIPLAFAGGTSPPAKAGPRICLG